MRSSPRNDQECVRDYKTRLRDEQIEANYFHRVHDKYRDFAIIGKGDFVTFNTVTVFRSMEVAIRHTVHTESELSHEHPSRQIQKMTKPFSGGSDEMWRWFVSAILQLLKNR